MARELLPGTLLRMGWLSPLNALLLVWLAVTASWLLQRPVAR